MIYIAFDGELSLDTSKLDDEFERLVNGELSEFVEIENGQLRFLGNTTDMESGDVYEAICELSPYVSKPAVVKMRVDNYGLSGPRADKNEEIPVGILDLVHYPNAKEKWKEFVIDERLTFWVPVDLGELIGWDHEGLMDYFSDEIGKILCDIRFKIVGHVSGEGEYCSGAAIIEVNAEIYNDDE